MLVSLKCFKLAVAYNKETNGYHRMATNEDISILDRDDFLLINTDKESPTPFLLVNSLAELRKVYRFHIMGHILLTILFWVLALVYCRRLALSWNQSQYLSQIILVAIPAALAVLFTPGVFNPIVRDANEHWINLRTGRTNLNEGCTLQ